MAYQHLFQTLRSSPSIYEFGPLRIDLFLGPACCLEPPAIRGMVDRREGADASTLYSSPLPFPPSLEPEELLALSCCHPLTPVLPGSCLPTHSGRRAIVSLPKRRLRAQTLDAMLFIDDKDQRRDLEKTLALMPAWLSSLRFCSKSLSHVRI